MRIAIFTDTFYPNIDGIATSTVNLARGLVNRGHVVHIITSKNKAHVEEFKYKNVFVERISGIPAIFYPGFKLTNPLSLKLLRYVRKNKIELIHFQTPVTMGINAILIAKLLKLPLSATFHTFIAHKEYRKHMILQSSALDNISWAYVRAYYNQCDRITCPSETTNQELLKHNFNKPISVISNGIDFSKFQNKRKVKQIEKSLLYVGRIAYEKNIFYLLDCFKLILERMPDAKLTVVGDGPQMKEFKKRIKTLGIEENIVLKGSIKNETLIKSGLFKKYKLFITTSVTENQPMTILEAQANGTVCVAVDGGGMKDLIKNGSNGFLVEEGKKEVFANRVTQLLSNEKLLNKMRKNTLLEVKKHNISGVIDTWEEVYSGLIKIRRQELRKESAQ